MSKFVSRDTLILYNVPDITETETDEVIATLKPGWLTRGPCTMRFEKQFAEYLDAKYAVIINPCMAALHVALAAQGIDPGDEVITTPMAYVASANTVVHPGTTPVLADTGYRTACINPDEIGEKITLRTKVIVPVRYSGQVCDPDRICEIADKHNLSVSEDAAHTSWGRYKGRLIGDSLQGAASYGFYAMKNLCTGGNGMLVIDNEETAVKARMFSNSGMNQSAWNRYAKGGTWKYDIAELGYKSNMFDIQAALGLVQLRRLEEIQEAHLKIAARFQEAFGAMDVIEGPLVPEYTTHRQRLYAIRIVSEVLTIDRDQFVTELNERNIDTGVHFIPVYNMPTYTKRFGYKPKDFSETQRHFKRYISLSLYPGLTDEQVQYIIDAVVDIAAKYHK